MTDNTATNPFLLAQYIVSNPADPKRPFNFIDSDPTLNHLMTQLKDYMLSMIKSGELHRMADKYAHPNAMLENLAKRADEFCPGRTQSDLLFKMMAVHSIMDQTMTAYELYRKLRPSINVSVSLNRNALEDLLKEFETIHSKSKL